MAASSYKSKFTEEERLQESTRIRTKYSDKLPIIVEPAHNCDLKIPKSKYLVPATGGFTMGEFIYVVRQKLELAPEVAIYLFVGGNCLASSSMMMSDVFEKYVDKDGFLYVTYSFESTFG